MPAADDKDEAILKEALAENVARGNRAFDEAEIDFAVREGGHDLFGVAAGDSRLDAGVLLEESAEHARQDVLRNRHRSANAEGAGGFAAEAVERGARFFGEAGAFASVAEQDCASFGEADAAFAAIEECSAEFFFEGMNLLADRGLAEVQTLGGTAEAGLFSNGAEDLQPEIFHKLL